ncbi:MAG: hypothetical protein ABSA67_05805 [Candidatus Brocadiia bacterium]|jgi:hypothetical protein
MKASWPTVAALCSTLLAGSFQASAVESQPVVRGEISQPTKIPGNWVWEPPPMPPLEKVLREAKPNPLIYGLYEWAGEYLEYRDSIKKVGWRAYRCGGPMSDQAMQAFAEDDTEVMYCAGTAPQKLDATPQEDEAFIRNYAQSITALLTRYGPNGTLFRDNPKIPNRPLRNIEIWNEPNFEYLIRPDNRPQAELEAARFALYAKLLPAAYTAAKNWSKEVNVVGFGAGGASAGDIRFIQSVNRAGPSALRSYDILSTHPYVEPVAPEATSVRSWGRYSIAASLAEIRADLASHGRAEVPIWYTEVGWPISKQDGGSYAMAGIQVNPDLQAAYVCRLYAFAQRLGVRRVHIMSVNDTDNFNSGFFQRDGSWRPSAHAVQTMIQLMPSPRLIGVLSDGEDGYFAYRFAPKEDPAATPVLMAWNVSGPKVVELPMKASRATIFDMVGHRQTIAVTGDKIRLEIGPLPVYVRGE